MLDQDDWIKRVVNETLKKDQERSTTLPKDCINLHLSGGIIATDGGYTFRHLAPKKYQCPYGLYDSRGELLHAFLLLNGARIVSGEVQVYRPREPWKAVRTLRHVVAGIVCITKLAPDEVVNREAMRMVKGETEKWLRKS